jgi:hypothetical protein
MPGLDPGIHDEMPQIMALRKSLLLLKCLMDCRVKPGDDKKKSETTANWR